MVLLATPVFCKFTDFGYIDKCQRTLAFGIFSFYICSLNCFCQIKMCDKILIIGSFFVLLFNTTFGKSKADSLLLALDKTLTMETKFDEQKEQNINNLKQELAVTSIESIHDIYLRLYKEYEAYIFDSAMVYAQKHLKISEIENNIYWINECKMQLARMYSTFARFQDALNLMHSIDTTNLHPETLGAYYNSFAEIYNYSAEYNSNGDLKKYLSLKDAYRDSAIMVLPRGTYGYDINYGRRCIEENRLKEAENILLPYLSTIQTNTRDYAILTSIIAYLYEAQGDVEQQKYFLILSAIADVEASVKENTSLSYLAFLLFNEGDMTRANRYIKKSMEDANFYNSRLRNVQVSKVLPIIDTAYQIERESHQKNQRTAIFIIAFLLVILSGIVFFLILQMKRLAKTRREVVEANKELQKVNTYLSETNQIKEEYIGRFLNQCSIYIDKMEKYRKHLNKKATVHNLEELFTAIKSTQFINDELKEFYHNFDSTFLNLFPDFVEQFNQLLPEEDRVAPKTDASLTAELRIFALIRLGITDSAKIADFLRYSITTIYNYRSKYRNKTHVPKDKFEEIIMKIGTINKPIQKRKNH